MFKNYFYLNRAILEIKDQLIGSIIQEVYTQEKETLYFRIATENNDNRHLVVSLNQSEPYIIIKEAHHKAKKNVAEFFQSYLPDVVESIEIAVDDRIIRIICSKIEFYISIRGTLSNIILKNSANETEFFKKVKRIDEDELMKEITSHNYSSDFNIPDFPNDIPNITELKKKFTYLTKDILNELKARTSSDEMMRLIEILKSIMTQIGFDPIQIFYTNDLGRYVFVPSSFISLSRDSEILEYSDYQEAVIKYLSVENKLSREQSIQKEISKYLDKELNGLSQKLNALKKRVDEGSKEIQYRKYADLLLSNLYKIKKGMKEIILDDFSSSESIKIVLNDKLAPKQNVDYYYDKARGEKINYEKSLEFFEDAKNKYHYLLKIKNEFDNSNDIATLQKIKEELGLKDKKVIEKNIPQAKFRHFIIEGIYHVFVGRDSKSNDQLSLKFAKQNDYWFHARGYAGSHVVLRVDNPKEGIPKNILKDAASIAAFYSKAKTAGTAPVAYTFAKYVTKRKGMEPGKVMLQKEQVLLVKPGIPKNSEQVED